MDILSTIGAEVWASASGITRLVIRTKPGLRCHGPHHDIEASLNGGKRPPLDWPKLSSFSREVLEAIGEIPRGETRTYGELLGNRYARAVGNVCNKNPFPLIIPCHRIVGAQDIGGFAYGVAIKLKLLALESADYPAGCRT